LHCRLLLHVLGEVSLQLQLQNTTAPSWHWIGAREIKYRTHLQNLCPGDNKDPDDKHDEEHTNTIPKPQTTETAAAAAAAATASNRQWQHSSSQQQAAATQQWWQYRPVALGMLPGLAQVDSGLLFFRKHAFFRKM
jgi:hypothetical protein